MTIRTQHLFIYQNRTVKNARYKIAKGAAPIVDQRHPIATVAIEVTVEAGTPAVLKASVAACHPADQFIRSEGVKKALGRLQSKKVDLILDLNDSAEFVDGDNAGYLIRGNRRLKNLTQDELNGAAHAINSVVKNLFQDAIIASAQRTASA